MHHCHSVRHFLALCFLFSLALACTKTVVSISKAQAVAGEDASVLAGPPGDVKVVGLQSPPLRQMRVQGDSFIWLDPLTDTIYRSKRQDKSVQNAVLTSVSGNINVAPKEKLWSGPPLQKPSGLAVSETGKIYVVDQRMSAIFEMVPGEAPKLVFSGHPLSEPAGIAAVKERLYILNSAGKIFCLNVLRREIIEEFPKSLTPIPDRLLYWNGHLLALSSGGKILYQFITSDYPALPDQLEETWKIETLEKPDGLWTVIDPARVHTLNRGQRIELGEALSAIIDYGVWDDTIYFLDVEARRVVLLPLNGGETTYVPYQALSESPDMLAADETGIYLGDSISNRFAGFPLLVPVSINFVGEWTLDALVKLYDELRNKGLLPSRKHRIGNEEVTLEELSVSEKVLPLGYQDKFQCLFCELNPSVCNLKQRSCPIVKESRKNSPDHLKLSAVDILLPDLKITTYIARRGVQLPLDPDIYPSETFKDVREGPLGNVARKFTKDETVSQEELSRILLELNDTYKGDDILAETEGAFMMPVQSARVLVAVPKADVINEKSNFRQILSKTNVSGVSLNSNALPKTAEPDAGAATLPTKESGMWPVQTNPRCEPTAMSPAMALSRYCLPVDIYKRKRPVPVGVIDNIFDFKHEAFKEEDGSSALVVPESELDRTDIPGRTPGQVSFLTQLDHGTHVSGLIGARGGEDGFVGIYPFAKLYGMNVANREAAVGKWRNVHLFNISLGEQRKSDAEVSAGVSQALSETATLKDAVENEFNSLFVIAAGNDGDIVLRSSLAARGMMQNVITVGAADSPTTMMPQSNWGKDAVYIVAPGKTLRSALYGNYYGVADGTSQATALVTGTAAILKAIEDGWKPWQIKFRIVSTADIWTDLVKPIYVYSGFLNIERAVLDTDDLVIKYTLDSYGDNGQCRGRIDPEYLDKELTIKGKPGEADLHIKMRHLLRVVRDPIYPVAYSIIYYTEKKELNIWGDVDHTLERRYSVEGWRFVENYSFKLNASNPTAGSQCINAEVDFRDLDDFVNTFSEE